MSEIFFPALFPGFALPEDLAEALERELEKRESSGGKAAVRRSSDAVTRQRQATRQAVRPR